MKKSRFQFDLMTALMLMIAISILLGLNLEARPYRGIVGFREYGWPFVCCELSGATKCEWQFGGCIADGLIAALLLAAISIGRDRLFHARSASQDDFTPE